jgi:hypothetical protein
MLEMGVAVASSAIYSIVHSFLRTAPNKSECCRAFTAVIVAASTDSDQAARALIGTFSVVAAPGELEEEFLVKRQPPKALREIVADLAVALKSETASAQKKFVTRGDVVINGRGCIVPIVLLLGDKVIGADSIRNVRVQPLFDQWSYWNRTEVKSDPVKVDTPPLEAFDIYVYAVATQNAVTGIGNQEDEEIVPPDAFILTDDELAVFEKRVREIAG